MADHLPVDDPPLLTRDLHRWNRYASLARSMSGSDDAVQCRPVEVQVGERGLERAVKHLKRKMAAEGIPRELKRRRHYLKPSVRKRKKAAEAARRRRKRLRQYVPDDRY